VDPTKTLEALPDATLERLRGILARAEQGDASALPEVRQALAQFPELWQRYGDLALHARQAWVDRAAGANLLMREALDRKLDALRGELVGPEASPLERLLGEQIVICWLQSAYADATVAQVQRGEALATLKVMMQRQESAQRRLLAATKQLALVRKLLRPAVSPVELALRGVPEQAAVSSSLTGGLRTQRRTVAGTLN
jgi:hypothetical protein